MNKLIEGLFVYCVLITLLVLINIYIIPTHAQYNTDNMEILGICLEMMLFWLLGVWYGYRVFGDRK